MQEKKIYIGMRIKDVIFCFAQLRCCHNGRGTTQYIGCPSIIYHRRWAKQSNRLFFKWSLLAILNEWNFNLLEIYSLKWFFAHFFSFFFFLWGVKFSLLYIWKLNLRSLMYMKRMHNYQDCLEHMVANY